MFLLFMFLLATSLNLYLGVPWLRMLKESWEYNIITKLDYPSYARDQRLRVNIALPTGGEISIFRSLWTKFYGVIIY